MYGYSGWYVDNLTFILSNGKQLGRFQFESLKFPINISDFVTTNNLQGSQWEDREEDFATTCPSCPTNHHHCFNSYLDGIKVTASQFW